MRRTILGIIIVLLITTPCLAQEIEPEGLFSIEGTQWQSLPIWIQILPFPWLQIYEFSIGFYGGKIYRYPSSGFIYESFYLDMLVASIFRYKESDHSFFAYYDGTHFGILQPIGVGVMIVSGRNLNFIPVLGVMILIKVEDDWTPPEEE